MLCPTCPKRATCKSPCADLERELARIEKPLREVLVPHKKLKLLSDAITTEEYIRSQYDAEQDYENREVEEERRKLFQAVNLSLDELTLRQRDCVRLRYWEDKSPAEIAEILGISRQVVLRHLEASKKIIRKYLTDPLKTGCNFAHIL